MALSSLGLPLLSLAAHLSGSPLQRADTVGESSDSIATARVTISLGTGTPAIVIGRSVELSVTAVPRGRPRGSVSAQLRFMREPDSLSGELTRRVASGASWPQVDAVIEADGRVVVLHLRDVHVTSTRLIVNSDDTGLTQQRLALEESIAQLTAQRAEAQRQLAATETLARERLSPTMELARARSDAEVVDKRLVAQQHRLRLVNRQIAAWAPVQEEVALVASRADVETRPRP